ncbi:hypothetical protein OSC48_14415 [Pseudomonas quebecensis]|uniref:hypothetical protein n=1 Tax=Pseudomonas quebecensis TaxID=2995174 RepID=UPI002260B0B1|nr:hypothetical protein [Pseudomonas quebecensis]UZW21738.1 hypothetical protein OSC48_14415 [Pseudomonas quebecensis]
MSFREMVQAPRLRSVTQGSIFNYAKCQDFHTDVLGLFISARCDLAQNKQSRYIYIPLVKVKAWVDFYLIPKLFCEQRAALISAMQNILKQNNHQPSSVSVFGAEKAAELLQGTKAYSGYFQKLKELQRVDEMLESGVYDKTVLTPKSIRSKTDDLISNKIEGVFLIDNVVDYQNGDLSLGSYVAILSEPSSIQRPAALGIAEGLDHKLVLDHPLEYDCITPMDGEMSYVMCNVRSPYIELILQRFSALYSRIGVDDPSIEIKEKLAMEAAL